jgi:hypothetical protein
MTNMMRMRGGMSQYCLAMMDPFDSRALGVKVPDSFATPTTAFRVRGYNLLNTQTFNQGGYLFMCNPVVSMVSMPGAPYSTDMKRYDMPSISEPGRRWAFGAIDIAILEEQYSSWRVVAGGIRLRNSKAATDAPAIISMATVPQVGHGPSPTVLNAAANGGITLAGADRAVEDITGINSEYAYAYGGSLPVQSNFQRCTSQDLITKSVTIGFRNCDPRAFEFRKASTANALNGGDDYDDVVVTNTGGVVVSYSGNHERYSSTGHSCIMLQIDTQSASEILPDLEVEYIYHLEGVPRRVGFFNAGRATISEGATDMNKYGTATHLADVAYANRGLLYKIGSAAVGGLFGKATDPASILALQY